jgi:hypothetical protein
MAKKKCSLALVIELLDKIESENKSIAAMKIDCIADDKMGYNEIAEELKALRIKVQMVRKIRSEITEEFSG